MFNFAPILKNYKLLFNIRVNYLFPRLADFLHSFMLWTILLPNTDSQIFVNIIDYQFTWLNFEIQLEICYTCSWACNEFLPTFFKLLVKYLKLFMNFSQILFNFWGEIKSNVFPRFYRRKIYMVYLINRWSQARPIKV